MPSTWPCTKCPPNSFPAVSGCSRFTRAPRRSSWNDVQRIVSPERSAVKRALSSATTVRQHPLTAMLFETASDGARLGASTTSFPPSFPAASESMVPTCSMIPVNILEVSFYGKVRAELPRADFFERRNQRILRAREGQVGHACKPGRKKQGDLLHDPFRQRRAVQLAPRLQEHAQDIPPAEFFHHGLQRDAAALAAHRNHFHASAFEPLYFR